MSNRKLYRWYKDRDFPELKTGNDDIVCTINNEKELERVRREHNDLLEMIQIYEEALLDIQLRSHPSLNNKDTEFHNRIATNALKAAKEVSEW